MFVSITSGFSYLCSYMLILLSFKGLIHACIDFHMQSIDHQVHDVERDRYFVLSLKNYFGIMDK